MIATRKLGSRPVRLSLDALDARDLPSISLLSGALLDAKVSALVKADVDVDAKVKLNVLGIKVAAKADVDIDLKAKVDLGAKLKIKASDNYNSCHNDHHHHRDCNLVDLGLKAKVNVGGYHSSPLVSAKVGLFIRL